MTTLTPHLSSAELESEYKPAADPVAKSHFHALWLVSKDYAVTEVAGLLSFSARWVHRLIKRYNERGPEALADLRWSNGAKPRIVTPEALTALRERIMSPPADGGVWSAPKVARWLADFHGLASVHDQRGWDALVAIGYSVQKPRPRHPQAATSEDRQALKKTSKTRRLKSKPGIRGPALNSGRWMSTGSA